MKKEYKVMIPNLLTLSRAILTPIMILLSIFKQFNIALILIIIGAITDMIDGKLARYWNTVSLKGAKLDAVCDKIFAIGIIICLCFKDKSIIPILILETILAITNLYYHFKTNKTESLMIGKIKTTFLFITMISYYLSFINQFFINLKNGFNLVTINLQILCLISYFVLFYKTITKKELTIEDSEEHQKIMNDIEDKTIKIDNLVELAKQYGTIDDEDDIY